MNALRATHCIAPTTWNRIPDNIRQIVVELSLEHPELTPRELSVLLLEESQIFVSESSFYPILHERGLLERMEHDFGSVEKRWGNFLSYYIFLSFVSWKKKIYIN